MVAVLKNTLYNFSAGAAANLIVFDFANIVVFLLVYEDFELMVVVITMHDGIYKLISQQNGH